MSLTLNDLTLLIELVERELVDLSDNIANDAEFADDYKELFVQVGVTSDNLRAEYKSQWTEESGFPTYEDLIVEIEEMFIEDEGKNHE
ncbi:MAG: hypothetical protein EOO01_18915 [Chitinophagaceae bacterium]|nr:MAG: hypothetical protein EOO01_18915 [Chitinophagaceae bacterium]